MAPPQSTESFDRVYPPFGAPCTHRGGSASFSVCAQALPAAEQLATSTQRSINLWVSTERNQVVYTEAEPRRA